MCWWYVGSSAPLLWVHDLLQSCYGSMLIIFVVVIYMYMYNYTCCRLGLLKSFNSFCSNTGKTTLTQQGEWETSFSILYFKTDHVYTYVHTVKYVRATPLMHACNHPPSLFYHSSTEEGGVLWRYFMVYVLYIHVRTCTCTLLCNLPMSYMYMYVHV